MQSRADKIKKLRENVRTNAERATRHECQKLRIGRQSKKARGIYEKFHKEFQVSAYQVEKQLPEVWN